MKVISYIDSLRNHDAVFLAEKFRVAFSMASDAMILIRLDNLEILEVNQAAAIAFGYSANELEHMSFKYLSEKPDECINILRNRFSYHSRRKYRAKDNGSFIASTAYGYFRHHHTDLALISIRHSFDMMLLNSLLADQKTMNSDNRLMNKLNLENAFLQGEICERGRLSRELHDHIGHMLINTKLSVEKCMLSRGYQEVMKQLELLLDHVINVTNEIRSISHHIPSGFVRTQSLTESIRQLIKRLSDKIRIKLEFIEQPVPDSIVPFAHLHIYRIVEECLTNIVKHSGARRVEIRIGATDDQLLAEIIDNGKGLLTHPPKNSFGILVMQHRASLLQGNISMESKSGKFFKIRLSVPISRCISD